MAYTKTLWKARQGTSLNRYRKSQETADSVVLVNTPDLTEPGTPISPDLMNHIEQGIADAHQIAESSIKRQPARSISVAGPDLQATLNGLDKYLADNVTIALTSDCDSSVTVSGFCGVGALNIQGAGKTLRGLLFIRNCSIVVTINNLTIEYTSHEIKTLTFFALQVVYNACTFNITTNSAYLLYYFYYSSVHFINSTINSLGSKPVDMTTNRSFITIKGTDVNITGEGMVFTTAYGSIIAIREDVPETIKLTSQILDGMFLDNRPLHLLDSHQRKLDYSNSERATGEKWVNGKPIYQRTVRGNIVAAASTAVSTTLVGSGVADLVASAGWLNKGDSAAQFQVGHFVPVSGATSTSYNIISGIYKNSSGQIVLHSQSNVARAGTTNNEFAATLWYTKA